MNVRSNCLEAPSKPLEDSEQAAELNPAEKQRGESVFAVRDPSVVLQPGVRSLDLPAVSLAAQFAAVLPLRLHAVLAMGTDQINSARFQPIAQGVAVGRSIVEQSRSRLR